MKRVLPFVFVLFSVATMAQRAQRDTTGAAKVKPDTVKVGMYFTSIHNIDFRAKEYDIHFWLWFKYKKKDFDFSKFLEIPNAKEFIKLFDTTYNTPEGIYMLVKLQCTMKDSWKVTNFPFDRQTLRLSFENSQYSADSLVYIEDTFGENYDSVSASKGRVISGWNIDSFKLVTGKREYKTNFGDDRIKEAKEIFSTCRVRISISRPVFGLFLKTFLGMYIAFLIAFVCFFIHTDGIDSRFGLSVGSLFAVIGNKYIIDSTLPETTSFTLVDTLHGLTLFVIFIVIASTAVSLKYIKQDKMKKAMRLDNVVAIVTLSLYLIANFYFIYDAIKTVDGG